MPNDTLTLLKTRLTKRDLTAASISPVAAILCEVIDEYNAQHWHDRDRYHERIRALEEANSALRAEIHRLKTKGQAE